MASHLRYWRLALRCGFLLLQIPLTMSAIDAVDGSSTGT